MNGAWLAILATLGGLGLIFLVALGAVATYDAMADGDMMDGTWDMMGGSGGGPQTTGSASGLGEVRIVDFRFEPTVLTVTPGTVVTWTNEDSVPHTATSDGRGFDTSRLDKGESAEVAFDTPGTFAYICSIHPSMEGEIIVAGGEWRPRRGSEGSGGSLGSPDGRTNQWVNAMGGARLPRSEH